MNVNAVIQVGAGQIAILFFLIAAMGWMLFVQLNKIEKLLKRGSHNPPTRIVLALPIITRNGVPMPNLEIANDTVVTIPIQTQDAGGQVVPPQSGDTFTAVSSLPASLGVAVNGANLVLTPLVQASPGISVTVSDSDGLTQAVQLCDIVPDLSPKNIVLDLAGETTTSQPVPPNPGP